MRIVGEVVAGADIGIGEITTTTTRHQDLFAGFIGMVEYHDFSSTFAGFDCAHQAGGAGADDQDVCFNGVRWHIIP